MMRLRKLKKQQDQREEERKARVKREQAEKDKYNNLEEYEAATSDPYIVFSIDPPTAPGCKVLRTGGYFGRTVRTDMMTNTLNPTFEEARKPLAYLGTRSELENELLRIRVYDWDFFSADDLIGQADVPLNGLLEYGQVEVELTLDQPDTSKSKVRGKYPKITKPAGKLFGQILFEGKTPDYQQLGLLIERKPGITYLAVRLNRATKLIPADPNGTSDPFVVVDWDGAQQTSKVIMRTLEPEWRQTLYFPMKLVTLTQQALASKPSVSIRVFDQDEAGHDLLGSCEIPLHRITSAEHAKMEEEVGVDGRVHKGRVLKLRHMPLILPGNKIQSTLDLELYFVPDLPLDIVLEEQAERQVKELDEVWANRVKSFWRALPGRIQMHLRDAVQQEVGREDGFEMRPQDIRRLVSAEDQDETWHLFCEYLAPQQPPSDMSDPAQVARMVRCVTWAADTDIFKKETRKDVWQSPSFFLEMRKGDFEDHALLMCNLFLGLGEDAYVCVGRVKGATANEKRHVWVMTRHRDRSVKMWETSTGKERTLPNRWHPPMTKEEVLEEARKQRAKDAEAGGGEGEAEEAENDKKGGGSWFGRKKKDANALVAVEPQAEPDEEAGLLGRGADPYGVRSGVKTDAALVDAGFADLEDVMSDQTLSRADIEGQISEVVFYDDEELEQMRAMGAGVGLDGDELMVKSKGVSGESEWDAEQGMLARRAREEAISGGTSDLDPDLPRVQLPYATIECIFNHKQLWISTNAELSRPLAPDLLVYDLPEQSNKHWEAFVEKREQNQGLPKPFYTPRRLAAKVAVDRLRNMDAQILGEIMSQITLLRSNKLSTVINKSTELVQSLNKGLELQEAKRMGDPKAPERLSTWEREVKTRLPAGSTLKARAFNYAYTDAKKIRKHLLQSENYAEDQSDGIEFAVAVKTFAFHGGICSVWVYYGLIDTDLTNN